MMGTYEITTEGGTYHIETADAPTGEGVGSSVVADIPSPSFLDRAYNTYKGASDTLNNTLTLGLGNKAAALGSGIVGTFSGEGFGNAYDRTLGEKEKSVGDFANENPVAAFSLGMLGPGPEKLAAASSVLGKVANVVKPGATLGGILGFNSSDGSLEDKLGGAASGAALGGGMGLAGAGIASGLAKLSPIASEQGDKLLRKSIGARQSDYSKTANELQMIAAPNGDLQTLTAASLDDLISNGKLGKSLNPSDMKQAVKQQTTALSGQVGQLIDAFDKQVGAPVMPNFDATLDKLAELRLPADKLEGHLNRLQKIESAIVNEGKGSLRSIQNQKVALSKEWDPNDTANNELTRSIYNDLQRTIEGAVPEVAPLNQELQKFKSVEPILNRGIAEKEAGDPIKAIVQFSRTSGGIASQLVAGSLLGTPGLGIATSALTGLGMTRTGQKLYGNALKSSSPILETLAGAAAKATNPASLGALNLGYRLDSPPSSERSLANPASLSNDQLSTGSASGNQQDNRSIFPSAGAADKSQSLVDRIQAQQGGSKDTKQASVSLRDSAASRPATQAQSYGMLGRPISTTAVPDKPDILNVAMNMLSNRPKQIPGVKYNSDPAVAKVEKVIDQDPYLSTLYEVESGRNPNAKNPESTAKGAFQFLNSTAKAVGLQNPLDIGQSLTAITKLTDENRARFGDDPITLYSAHYLGATVLNKLLNGKALTATEKSQVDYLRTKVLPRFKRIYATKIASNDLSEA